MKSGAKTSLLIVDDDAPIRKLLERVAVRAGFEVTSAKDGVEALELINQRSFDIAIIDLMMPRLSGYELVQKVSGRNPRPVIIVATAMTNAEVEKIDDTLVRRVIKKPFDVQAVAEALIETARHVAEKRAAADTPVAIAPPEAGMISIAAEDVERHVQDVNEREAPPDEPEKQTPHA